MMNYLSSDNFPDTTKEVRLILDSNLATLLTEDYHGDFYTLMAEYQRILSDNTQHARWPEINDKLRTLFLCGRAVPLDGPMIGITLSLRDSDFLSAQARTTGLSRSAIASLEILATTWNATLSGSGIWMGKTFEPVLRDAYAEKCGDAPEVMASYDEKVSRIGRNFFRDMSGLLLPVITAAWHLKDRPESTGSGGFDSILLQRHLDLEKRIPYNKTGGYFLADLGRSVLPDMAGKTVFSLNYRWPNLHPIFPMSGLIDEIVQISDGMYLGQLIYATRHISCGALPFLNEAIDEAYTASGTDYGYQNNGYFLMLDPANSNRIYAAFPQLAPRPDEIPATTRPVDTRWQSDTTLQQKFTRLIVHPTGMAGIEHPDESVLQMLQRISAHISEQSNPHDRLLAFEPLHRLFAAGIAPCVRDGLFQGSGARGYNVRLTSSAQDDWYGEKSLIEGFDYYHGATLNLHCGFADTSDQADSRLSFEPPSGPNILNKLWHSIGKFIFPWAGKSFEKISPRKLSMLLDESPNLTARYPARVSQLKCHPASSPHYLSLKADAQHLNSGRYAEHLTHSWDQGMSPADKDFWRQEALERYVMGYNLQDKRILMMDSLMALNDMNYRVPDTALQQASVKSGSPFERQGYAFLGVADQPSILPANREKRVFQFNYRYPLIGGPAPIGYCLDELVEIADGLFLGQLIYATALQRPFNSGVNPAEYDYQLFGYFLLLDDEWERHRQAIGLDTLN